MYRYMNNLIIVNMGEAKNRWSIVRSLKIMTRCEDKGQSRLCALSLRKEVRCESMPEMVRAGFVHSTVRSEKPSAALCWLNHLAFTWLIHIHPHYVVRNRYLPLNYVCLGVLVALQITNFLYLPEYGIPVDIDIINTSLFSYYLKLRI